MQTSKMYERINWYKKEYVHEQYSRIVDKFKDYEKITKKKMIEAIYAVYDDYNNIIDICTTRELKYLKMMLDKETDMKKLLEDKYEWERKTLRNKFLVQDDYDQVFIPNEIIDKVKLAIKNINWDTTKKLDDLNEILVSYCKIQASALFDSVSAFGSAVTGIDEKYIKTHMLNNKLFNYYVFVYTKNFEMIGNNILVCLYQDYYYIEEQIDEERKKQGLAEACPIDLRVYKTLFYNDFDINNKKIKKFLDELKKLPFFWFSAIDTIREFSVLNIDRTSLKESIANVPALENYDLTEFFKILDEAMDEMPSGALNGFTPNQAKELKAETEKMKFEKVKKYTKQRNACLSKQDAKLFYKIYFALLEFTNNKYKINQKLKIYNKLGLNPYDLKDIIEKFWENKDAIISEFCLANPYKFNKEELNVVSEFKKGFRDIVIIAKYELEYTAVMNKDKTFMIKGINDNIDNIVSYQDLPQPVITSIIPFKNVLIYDGLLMQLGIKMGNGFEKTIEEEYSKSIKYYHL